jgi:hypothetical protein
MANKHHFVVDAAPFALDNDTEVFHADDRPYGLIDVIVAEGGAPDASRAWDPTRCSGRSQPCWSLGREPTQSSACSVSIKAPI